MEHLIDFSSDLFIYLLWWKTVYYRITSILSSGKIGHFKIALGSHLTT